MQIVQSINIGTPQPIPGKTAQTGMFKAPVAGAVAIGTLGLEGDAVMDRKHHGGRDQAVYLYFADDYAWWAAELGEPLKPGAFGENLTIEGVEGRAVAAGDRFVMDEIELEVTSHRTPCDTFARAMGDRLWVKRFHRAGRPGAYCRVITPGHLRAGETVRYLPFMGERFTVAEMMALDGVRDPDPAILRRGLQTPIHHKMRDAFESKLARLF